MTSLLYPACSAPTHLGLAVRPEENPANRAGCFGSGFHSSCGWRAASHRLIPQHEVVDGSNVIAREIEISFDLLDPLLGGDEAAVRGVLPHHLGHVRPAVLMTVAAIPEITRVSHRQGQIARAHQGQVFTFMSGRFPWLRFRVGCGLSFL